MKSFINKFKYFILGGIVVMAGTVYAAQVSVPSSNGSGFLLQSGSNGLYTPVSLTAGSNVSISTTTSNITISATGGTSDGYGFITNSYGGVTVQSTTSPIWLKGTNPYSLLASSTLTTYASTTYGSFTTASSTTGLFGTIIQGTTTAPSTSAITSYNPNSNSIITLIGQLNTSGVGAELKLFESNNESAPPGFGVFYEGGSNVFSIRSYSNSTTPVNRLTIARDTGLVTLSYATTTGITADYASSTMQFVNRLNFSTSTAGTLKVNASGVVWSDASSGSSASSTLLSDTNSWTGGNVFTRATSTSFGVTDFYAGSSAGMNLHANNGTDVAIFGAGNSANALFYGGVNVTGNLSVLGTSLLSSAYSSSTVYSSFLTASTTNLRIGLSDGCLNITSGLVGSTGSACGSGSSFSFPFTPTTWNSVYNVQSTTTALKLIGMYLASTSDPISNLGGNNTPGDWPAMIWNQSSTIGLSTGLAFGVSATLGGSPGGGIGFIRRGASSAGDLFFATANTGESMTEKLRIRGDGTVGIGTTTPFYRLTLASTTQPQLSLSAGAGLAQWTMRNAGGNFYLSTTTVAGTSTTTLAALAINGTTGALSLGTTTAGTLKVAADGTIWSDTSGGGGGYATIQDEGGALTTRTVLNFTGTGVSCADDTTKTTCTINSGSASAGGSDTQVQFNDGGALGGAVGWIWNKTKEIMGIGTTTPFTDHKVSIATSTGQNLVLLTGGNDAGVSFRNIGGSLFLSTTSPTTGATSTSPTGLVVDYSSGIGKVGVGSTTPWGALGIQPSFYDYSYPLTHIATSTNVFGTALHVTATSSTYGSNGVNSKATSDSGVRVSVATDKYKGGGLLDQFIVYGRFNTEGFLHNWCDTAQMVALSADGVVTGCSGYYFAEDGTGTTAIGSVTGGGASYTRVAAAVNADGAGIFLAGSTGTGWMTLGTSTPTLEVNYRIRNTNSTTTRYYIGFTNLNIAGTTYETEPTVGCYFTASSTVANWHAICRTAAATLTMVDTGIASTSVIAGTSGTGYQFYNFRIEADDTGADFYIKTSESGILNKVARITTTYPNNTLLNAGIHYGIQSINTSSGFDYFRLRTWWRDVLPSL